MRFSFSFFFLIFFLVSQVQADTLSIAVLGDLNGSLGDTSYASSVLGGVSQILSSNYDLILGTGDFIGGEDYKNSLSEEQFKKMWGSFNSKILMPILNKGIPFAPTPGNHDASIEREKEYYKTFWKNRVPKVNMVSNDTFPFYYSFTFRGVFFLSLNDVNTHNLTSEGTQRKWIIEQLNSQEAKQSIATIAFGHVPLYPVLSKERHGVGGKGKYYEILSKEQQGKKVNALEEILKKGRLSLIIFGHSHAYYSGAVWHSNELISNSLKVLSTPCLGYDNRYLDQRTTRRSQRGYSEILVNLETGDIKVRAYNYLGILIDKENLPKTIAPYPGIIILRQ